MTPFEHRRLIIAIDCDDVLIPSQAFLVDTYNRLYDTAILLGQGFEEWGANYDEVMRRCGDIAQMNEFKELKPDNATVQALRALAKRHELHLVTARKEEERVFTQAMFDLVLPGVFASMEFIGWGGSKGIVCQRIRADVLIDDNTHHLYDALAHGLPQGGAILFGDYPWNNTNRQDAALIYCADWPAVAHAVDSLATGMVK